MTPNAYQNAYQKYQQQSVTTMTQGEMLIKLFDETIKQLNAVKRKKHSRLSNIWILR